MRRPSNFFLTLAGVGGCLLAILCVAIIIFGFVIARQQNFSLLNLTSPQTNKIVIVDNELNIALVDPRTHAVTALTKDADGGSTREYDFPTWSPDSKYVAFVSLAAVNNTPDAAVLSIRADGSQLTRLFHTSTDFPVYLYWAPNSQRMSFLTQKDRSLALNLAQPDKENSTQQLETGSPFYWAWSPDSRMMLLHIGGAQSDSRDAHIALLNWQTNAGPSKLALGPASFQTPQWSPDGKQLVLAAADSTQDTLKVADARGENARTVVSYSGRMAFALSPAGTRIAYVATPRNVPIPTYGRLNLVNTDGTGDHQISNEETLAFFWSPDGKYIAYIIPSEAPPNNSSGSAGRARPAAQAGALYVQWRVLEVATGSVHTVATFLPTEKFFAVLPYFDQYSRSITFWSPDSKNLVYSAQDPNEAGNGTIWVVPVSEGSKPEKITTGLAAFWSWK